MHEIKEFEVLQFQYGQLDHIRESTPNTEIPESVDADAVSIDIQAEIGRSAEDHATLVGKFSCTLQTDQHLLLAEFRSLVDGFDEGSEEPTTSAETKSEMFHLVYPYIRNSLANIGRVADVGLAGLPLSATFAE